MNSRVAILYSGNLRANSLNPNFTKDNKILEATTKYFLNEEFKKKYDYDIFFSVDVMDVSKAQHYFGDNLKNIHLTETDWYLHPIQTTVPEYSFYLDKYRKNKFGERTIYESSVYQYYRLYCAYNLMLNYQRESNKKYDFIVRIRPDIQLMQDLMPIFNILEKTDKQIFSEHEQLCIVKYAMHDMFNFIEHIGTYNENIALKRHIYDHYIRPNQGDGKMPLDDLNLMFSPEKQFQDNVYYTLVKNNMNFTESFFGCSYPHYNLLYRENGLYGYLPASHPIYTDPHHIWVPGPTNIY